MSELRATTISDTAGTGPVTLTGQSAAKAWANWDGTGTVSLGEAYNISSITDISQGVYDYSFTNSFAAAPPCHTISVGVSGSELFADTGAKSINTTTEGRVIGRDIGANTTDADDANAIVHGDLA